MISSVLRGRRHARLARQVFTAASMREAAQSEVCTVLPFSYQLSRTTATHLDKLEVSYVPRVAPAAAEKQTSSASKLKICWPFARNAALSDHYRLFSSPYCRMGRIFEAMDALAADAAYRHGDGCGEIVCVTAAVDHIVCAGPLRVDKDLTIDAQVSWTGHSSLEVLLRLSQAEGDGSGSFPIAEAVFVMAARTPQLTAAAAIPALEATTDDELRQQAAGEANQARRKAGRKSDLMHAPPTAEEVAIVHDLFMQKARGEQLHEAVPIRRTVVKAMRLMHSQQRNLQHTIFGGFLMRMGYETAWAAARRHIGGSLVLLAAVDEVTFIKAVRIGALLAYDARVVYAKDGLLHVRVVTQCEEPGGVVGQVTNAFHFVFAAEGEQTIRPVVPESYLEAMEYLGGLRHHQRVNTVARREWKAT